MERLEIVPLHEIGRRNQKALAGGPHMAFRCNQASTILADNRNVGGEAYGRSLPAELSILRCSSA